MNRLVLIGNGFDLAHRLPTSYQDFIKWYHQESVSETLVDNKINYNIAKRLAVSANPVCYITNQ